MHWRIFFLIFFTSLTVFHLKWIHCSYFSVHNESHQTVARACLAFVRIVLQTFDIHPLLDLLIQFQKLHLECMIWELLCVLRTPKFEFATV